ncbi:MAG: LysM domain-containing protein [Dehalococcoidia bacterium]
MRLALAAVSLLVALSTACASTESTAPVLDRSASASATAAASGGGATTATEPSTAATTTSSAPSSSGAGGTYVVQSGDYLSRIAQNLGVTVAALSEANGITDPTLIYPGQVLNVPGGSGALTPSQLPTTAAAAAGTSAATEGDAETEAAPAGPSLVQRGIDRLPFELPATIQDPLDELLAREGGDILAFGIVLAVGGVALYIIMWLVASMVSLVRLAGSGGARGALVAVKGAGSGLRSLSSAASKIGPGGQTLATAGAPAEYAEGNEYEADAEEALRNVGSVAAAPVASPHATLGANALALAPVEEPEAAPLPVPVPAPSPAASGPRRGDTAREAFIELLMSWRRALVLDRDFYEEAGSVDGTRVQAVRVLMFSTVVGGFGWLLGGLAASAAATLALLIGWAVQTGATHVLATRGHYAPSNAEGLARAFAFALAPAAFLPLTMLPFIGVPVGLIVFGWILAATIVATESTLHLSITEALESTVPGWLVLWVAPLVAVQIVT